MFVNRHRIAKSTLASNTLANSMARSLALGLLGGGVPVQYLLRDLFTTDRAAGAVNGTAAEPGPGTRTVVDTENKLSISGGALVLDKRASATWGDPGLWLDEAVTRANGIAVVWSMTAASYANFRAGFDNDKTGAADRQSFLLSGGALYAEENGAFAQVGSLTGNVPYQFAVVLRGSGCYHLIKGGAYDKWTLLWVESSNNTAALYAGISNNLLTGSVDYFHVRNLGGAWATDDYGIATSRTANANAGATATSLPDALIEATWTAVTGETFELMFRRMDDNNCWILRCAQTGTIKLFKKEGGVETEYDAGKTQVWTNGVSYRIRVFCHDQIIKTWVGITIKHSYTAAKFNLDATGVKVSHAVTNLIAWPALFEGGDDPAGVYIRPAIAALAPTGAANQYSWHDFSDASTLYQDSAKTVPVVADADPIRVAVSKFALADDLIAPDDPARPLYQTNAQNTLPAAEWDGLDSQLDHAVWPNGDFTLFYAIKNDDVAKGSHFTEGGYYGVITGSGYDANPRVAIHFPDLHNVGASLVYPDGWNIVEITRSGNTWQAIINGFPGTPGTYDTTFASDTIGPVSSVIPDPAWWMDGMIGERVRYSAALDTQTRAQIRKWLAEKWGIRSMRYFPYV
jgi:hypothetical protein